MASIRKRNGKWQVQIRRLGSPNLAKSFVMRKDAEAWARQVEVQADRKELPKDQRQLERHTIGDLIIRYRDEVTPRKRGADVETIVFNAFLRHTLCSKRVSDLSPADFAAYRDERLQKVTPNTLKREFSPLHNMFETARSEWGLPIGENPLDNVRLDCPNNRRERRLRDGELERIKLAADKTKNRFIFPIILFALQTGLRRSEILLSTWSNIDFERRLMIVPRAKNGHSRTIPLSKASCALLHKLGGDLQVGEMNRERRIFTTTANALRLSWERITKRAGISDLHFHDLRHEAISRFFELGLTTPEVALISGHRDPRMLFRYSHPQQTRILEQLDRNRHIQKDSAS